MTRHERARGRLIRGLLWLAALAATTRADEPAAPLASPPLDDVLAAAAAIDRLVEQDLARHGLALRPLTDDETFVRRVSLDVVGRIPTVEETRAFLASDDPRRRSRLIEELLASPGHVSHLFNGFADLLRVRTKLARHTSGEPWIAWLKEALAANEPYDEMVAAMLVAEGPAHARGHGATGWWLRDREMPEDGMANTVRTFLGTRIECAQCHDHPYEPWTQRQFFEMVAFTGGLEYRHGDRRPAEERRALRDKADELRDEHGRRVARRLRRLVEPARSGLAGGGTGFARLPGDDGSPGELVEARTLFGDPVELPAVAGPTDAHPWRERWRGPRRGRETEPLDVGSRALFAEWLTSPDNPRFTTVIVNRLWKRAFGRGLVEPVDDLRDESATAHPALLEHLEGLMVELGYDLRTFQRVLLETRTWQAEAATADPPPDEPWLVAGPLLRRLTAEQVWDSLLTLVVDDLDGTLGAASTVEEIWDEHERVTGLDVDGLAALVGERSMRFVDPDAYREQRAAERTERRRVRKLWRRLERAEGKGKERRAEAARDELLALGLDPDAPPPDPDLVRASELPSPAPSDHLLWRFGQSDREQVDGARPDANVPQVLTLLNGFVESELLARRHGVLQDALRRAPSPEAGVDTAFLAILSRLPDEDERALWTADVAERGRAAWRDLVWTLLNTHEFLFVR